MLISRHSGTLRAESSTEQLGLERRIGLGLLGTLYGVIVPFVGDVGCRDGIELVSLNETYFVYGLGTL
jgi:hypothetical protein